MGNSKFISWGKFLIGWPLSLIAIIFIIKIFIDKGSGLNIKLNEINYIYLGISVLIFFAYYLLRSFLWQNLLKEKGDNIKFGENTYRFTFSELKRYVPGNIWSFLGRAHQFTELGIDKKIVGISILADIQLVIIGCVLATIPAIPWILNSDGDLKTQLSSLLPISAVLVVGYFLATAILYKKKYDQNEKLLNSFILPGYNINSKIKLILISTVTYFIFGIGNYMAMQSVHFFNFSNFISLSSFFTFSLLVGYLSFITPMGLGVREGIVTLGLSKLVSLADASFISIFTRIILITSELSFLGIVFLWKNLNSKK